MKLTYQYRLRPNKAQADQMANWVELLRRQYNYRLGQKLNWWEYNRCSLFSCSLVSCSIAPPIERPDYYWQKRDLLKTKELFPEYAEVYSQVLQDCIGRVKKTFDPSGSPVPYGGKPSFRAGLTATQSQIRTVIALENLAIRSTGDTGLSPIPR